MPIDDGRAMRCRAYGLDCPWVVEAMAAECGAGGLAALRAGAAAAGVSTAYLVRLQQQLLRDRQKEHRHAPTDHGHRGPH